MAINTLHGQPEIYFVVNTHLILQKVRTSCDPRSQFAQHSVGLDARDPPRSLHHLQPPFLKEEENVKLKKIKKTTRSFTKQT